mmetsp:Transcript_210/g.272  ORF Transcript_210/g.272 Transcript_210/m.272 type:complete len:266 (+) Transcript_210:59-856(+)
MMSPSSEQVDDDEEAAATRVPLVKDAWPVSTAAGPLDDTDASVVSTMSSSRVAAATGNNNENNKNNNIDNPQRINIPVGAWRDDFWDLCNYGGLHPSVLWSCCCVPIAVGQVATRLNLTWLGMSGATVSESTVTFRKLFYLVWIYWAIRAFILYLVYLVDPNVDSDEYVRPSQAYFTVCAIDDVFSYGYLIFSVIILRNTRKQVRSRYAIPEGDVCPAGCEDTCCSLWCPCFVAAQLMRHTTDYGAYPGRCCTETGLPPTAPSIV